MRLRLSPRGVGTLLRSVVKTEKPRWWRQFLCASESHHQPQPDTQNIITLTQIMRDVNPTRNDSNVFLVDIGCNSHPKYRAWCTVESWARQNPDLDVWILLTSLTIDDSTGLVNHLLRQYKNLRVVGADLDLLLRGTPVYHLFKSKKWMIEYTWPAQLLSDMVRVCVLWRWGGFYSDTDAMCTRTHTLPLNAVAFESESVIGTAVLTFTSQHPTLWKLMKAMDRNIIPGVYSIIGPVALTGLLDNLCGETEGSISSLYHKTPITSTCANLTIYPPLYFYPIRHQMSKEFFSAGAGAISFKEMFSSSYALHMWNFFSEDMVVRAGSESIYDQAAQFLCPIVYSRATLHSDVF
ncbi:hypothetical protein Pcinc_007517 [Petrolisthes cinctipes]|uniref:Alpha 1,4-glycosyltransferase domain-containing protein n=1 Tax=Petrolisthes cinctipes TaxID=88211 RepID=A0AAE1G8B3_PETCI|nr:hypothetical protein Pcinc_007517 [Petrolisthes cinctipes]